MNRFIISLLVALTVIFVSDRASGQVPGYRIRLDSLFQVLESNQRLMGSVTVRQGERVLYQRVLGYRDSAAAGWVPADGATAYRVGSVTKTFTAVLAYQLIDQGRLSLKTRLARFYPDLPGADSITIADLLGHTSGLADYTRGLDVRTALPADSLVRRIAAEPLQFAPGTARRYSNSNYLLLGYIVERLTGSSFQVALTEGIAKPAGLRRTYVGGVVDPTANEARAYYVNDGHWERQPDHAIENAGGAGALVSTTNDLTRFLAALFGGRLLRPASLTEMTHGFDDGTRRNGKGVGPFTIPGTGKSGYSHDGSIGAYAALVGHVPADSLSLALTVNGYNFPINRIFFAVWGILYGTGAALPSFAPVALDDLTVDRVVGVYSAEAYKLTVTVRRSAGGLEARFNENDPFPITRIGANLYMYADAGILLEFADAIDGVSPGFTLFQQRASAPLFRIPGSTRGPGG